MDAIPSPRACAQNRIIDFLERHYRFFNAPYGILPGMRALKRGGKVRLVSFGVAGTLS